MLFQHVFVLFSTLLFYVILKMFTKQRKPLYKNVLHIPLHPIFDKKIIRQSNDMNLIFPNNFDERAKFVDERFFL